MDERVREIKDWYMDEFIYRRMISAKAAGCAKTITLLFSAGNGGVHSTLLFFVVLILAVTWAYAPGAALFFRNDDWYVMGTIEPLMSAGEGQLEGLWGFLKGSTDTVVRHFHPLSLSVLLIKYWIFGNVFPLHWALSFVFHVFNITLVYLAGLRLSFHRAAALLGATLFGCSAMISDTVFWPGQFAFILVTTLTLLSTYLHPTLADEHQAKGAPIAFWLVTCITPLVFEYGYITVLLALGMFLIKWQVRAWSSVVRLALYLMVCVTLRNIAIGSLSAGVYFVGVPSLLYNVDLAMTKMLLGLLGGVFNAEVTDTLYILNPDFKHAFTFVALGLMAISVVCIWGYMRDSRLPKWLKGNCAFFLLMSLLPFVMTSFANDPTNANPNLSHQTPRYFYLPTAMMVIPVAQALTFKLPSWKVWLPWVAFILVAGMLSTRQYVDVLRPHTDNLQLAIATFEDTGNLPPINPAVRNGANVFRLDWSFDEKNVCAYLRIGEKTIITNRSGSGVVLSRTSQGNQIQERKWTQCVR